MIKSTKFVLLNFALIALALAAVACGDTTSNTTPANTPANNTSQGNTPAADSNKKDDAKDGEKKDDEKKDDAADAGDKIGVAECDDYIAKMRACLDDKVPAASRDMFKKTFDDSMKAWQEAAKTEAGKSGLAAGCKAALDAAKTSMSSFNCVW